MTPPTWDSFSHQNRTLRTFHIIGSMLCLNSKKKKKLFYFCFCHCRKFTVLCDVVPCSVEIRQDLIKFRSVVCNLTNFSNLASNNGAKIFLPNSVYSLNKCLSKYVKYAYDFLERNRIKDDYHSRKKVGRYILRVFS